MQEENTKIGIVLSTVKGVATAVIVTLIGVLLFALVVKFAVLNSGVIKAVNQFIKILSVFLGCAFSVRGKMGLIRGALIGVISTIITYLLFSLFAGTVSFGISFVIDLIFGLIIGAVSGVISVNVKK